MVSLSMKKKKKRKDVVGIASAIILFLSLHMFQHSCSFVAAATHSPSRQHPRSDNGGDVHTDKEASTNTIKIHAWLMYISTGFLLPWGVLVARFMKNARNNNEDDQQHSSSRMVNIFYYIHLTLQSTGIVVLTGGAIYSFRSFGYEFKHTHQKLGICLWGILWLQAIVGVAKPTYGGRLRPMWYGVHWLLGTGSIIACIVNIYMGMHLPELQILSKGTHTLEMAFTAQVAFMLLAYLAQDRWGYMLQQGRRNISKDISRSPLQSTVLLSPISYSMVPSTVTTMSYPMRHYLPS